jgi:hypothetical protein
MVLIILVEWLIVLSLTACKNKKQEDHASVSTAMSLDECDADRTDLVKKVSIDDSLSEFQEPIREVLLEMKQSLLIQLVAENVVLEAVAQEFEYCGLAPNQKSDYAGCVVMVPNPHIYITEKALTEDQFYPALRTLLGVFKAMSGSPSINPKNSFEMDSFLKSYYENLCVGRPSFHLGFPRLTKVLENTTFKMDVDVGAGLSKQVVHVNLIKKDFLDELKLNNKMESLGIDLKGKFTDEKLIAKIIQYRGLEDLGLSVEQKALLIDYVGSFLEAKIKKLDDLMRDISDKQARGQVLDPADFHEAVLLRKSITELTGQSWITIVKTPFIKTNGKITGTNSPWAALNDIKPEYASRYSKSSLMLEIRNRKAASDAGIVERYGESLQSSFAKEQLVKNLNDKKFEDMPASIKQDIFDEIDKKLKEYERGRGPKTLTLQDLEVIFDKVKSKNSDLSETIVVTMKEHFRKISDEAGVAFFTGGTYGSGKSSSLKVNNIDPQTAISADPAKVNMQSGGSVNPQAGLKTASPNIHVEASQAAWVTRTSLNRNNSSSYVFDSSLGWPSDVTEALMSGKKTVVDYNFVPPEQSLLRVLRRKSGGEDPNIPFDDVFASFNRSVAMSEELLILKRTYLNQLELKVRGPKQETGRVIDSGGKNVEWSVEQLEAFRAKYRNLASVSLADKKVSELVNESNFSLAEIEMLRNDLIIKKYWDTPVKKALDAHAGK